MKRTRKIVSAILILSIFLISISLSGCSDKKTYTINFYTEGELFHTYTVTEGSLISKIDAPDTETKYFKYWTYEDGTPYDFGFWTSPVVTSDVNLYAHYEFDSTLATNSIKNSHLSPHLKVNNNTNFKDKFLWFEFDSSFVGHGSGVIYDYKDGYYYALTNAHVILATEKIAEQAVDLSFFDISVVDYQDEEINAEVMFYSVDYDLAIIRFQSDKSYEIIKLAENNPEVGDNCIAVGNPLTSRNKITVGVGESYEELELTDSKLISDVTFNVFKHSANVKGGSSGGALLNEDLELIGINYAGKILFVVFSIDSFALPISSVKEFISLYDPA